MHAHTYNAPRSGAKILPSSPGYARRRSGLLLPRLRSWVNPRPVLAAGPAAAVAARGAIAQPQAGGLIPFVVGSHEYVELLPTQTATPGAATQDFIVNIVPGGFLRGVRFLVTGTGGALGGGALAADYPWNLFTSIALENIDGSEIIYPMPGFTHMCIQRFFRPWEGDPAAMQGFVGTINANFALTVRPEIRDTLGVLANTDARSQYRLRFTINTLAGIVVGGAPTAPALTIAIEADIWSQVDPHDLQGSPIDQLPDGLNVQTVHRREVQNLGVAGAANTLRHQNVGNELRGFIYIMRDGNNARSDLITTPYRLRLDNRNLLVTNEDMWIDRVNRFYGIALAGVAGIQSPRPTGVYVYPRFRFGLGGLETMGSYWLQTSNATFLQAEFATQAGVAGTPTAEIVSSEIIPVGVVPPELEGI
jgi:hypothetical protein